jgi:flagellar protein FlaF
VNAQALAQRAYAQTAAPTRTPRSAEYEVIARMTHRLKSASLEATTGVTPALAAALHDNRRMWITLAADVAGEGNGLPAELRARLFYLADFSRLHTSKVLAGKASVIPLLEINTAVLRGLRETGVAG